MDTEIDGKPHATASERLSRRRLLGIGGAVLLPAFGIAGCRLSPANAEQPVAEPAPDAAVEAPGPTPEAPAAPDVAVIAGIQDVLNRRASALAALDRDAFMATIDQHNLTWRRIQGEVFSRAQAAGRRSAERYTVTRVQPKQNGYYKAWIDVAPAGSTRVQNQAAWVFRPTETGWLHSEILNEELGPRLYQETEHFRLMYFAWDEDVIDRIGTVAEQAHDAVTEKLGAIPSVRTTLSVNPTYGAHSGLRGHNTVAAYDWNVKNLILIRSIESFGAGYTSPGEPTEQALVAPMTHEYTHLVSDQIVPLVKMQAWMYEGLAEYVAGHWREGEVRAAFRAGRQMTLEKASDAIEWGADPARGYTASDVSLAYGEAAFAVGYFVERFGLDTFFELARVFAESRKWNESFVQICGLEWPQFQEDWQAWVRRRLNI
ncbi:MAG: hypothetical protein HY332_08215 [Chloroflexi bacterium]|nr:hypothetical protein [Chloroflexota bacterium]